MCLTSLSKTKKTFPSHILTFNLSILRQKLPPHILIFLRNHPSNNINLKRKLMITLEELEICLKKKSGLRLLSNHLTFSTKSPSQPMSKSMCKKSLPSSNHSTFLMTRLSQAMPMSISKRNLVSLLDWQILISRNQRKSLNPHPNPKLSWVRWTRFISSRTKKPSLEMDLNKPNCPCRIKSIAGSASLSKTM